ncbi:hypothetical protein TH1_03370 [Thalassospira lucentensis MCCC 1A00383 = DSM 14000]|nr:hypothetical protein TH1_03370 [Thalassospira lucentensis MCCC 1A00383 = DSM 14000]
MSFPPDKMTGLEPFACATSDVPVDHAMCIFLGNNAISCFIAFGVPQFFGVHHRYFAYGD